MDAKLKDYKHFTLDLSLVNKSVTTIVKDANNFAGKLAQVATSCVFAALVHGDVRPARNLSVGLSNNSKGSPIRVNKLRDWFLDNGPFVWEEIEVQVKDKETGETKIVKQHDLVLCEEKQEAILAELDTEEKKMDKVVAMITSPYWSGKGKETKYKPYNLDEEFRKFVAQAQRKVAKAKDEDDFEGIDNLIKFAKTFNVKQASEEKQAA